MRYSRIPGSRCGNAGSYEKNLMQKYFNSDTIPIQTSLILIMRTGTKGSHRIRERFLRGTSDKDRMFDNKARDRSDGEDGEI